jgi:hypothetical protein
VIFAISLAIGQQLCGKVGPSSRKYHYPAGTVTLIDGTDRFRSAGTAPDGYTIVRDQWGQSWSIHPTNLSPCSGTDVQVPPRQLPSSSLPVSSSSSVSCPGVTGNLRSGCRVRITDQLSKFVDCDQTRGVLPFLRFSGSSYNFIKTRAQMAADGKQGSACCVQDITREILCAASPLGVDVNGVVAASRAQGFQNPPWITGVQGGRCDQKISRIFGDRDTLAAASGYEPFGFDPRVKSCEECTGGDPSGVDRSQGGGSNPNEWGHLNGYAGHLYGSTVGISDTNLFIPPGFVSQTPPSGKDAVATFFYPRLFNEQNVLLCVYHVQGFRVDQTRRNEAGSIFIGRSGGPGGDTPFYKHTHVEVHSGRVLGNLAMRQKTRKFFSKVFCP